MSRQSVEVTGGPELKRALQRLETGIRVEILSDAVEAGAGVMLKEAKARAPRGSGPAGKYGRLHDNIVKSLAPSLTDPNRVVWEVGPNDRGFYGLFLEKGTKGSERKGHRGRGSIKVGSRSIMMAQVGGKVGGIRARHWLRKSFQQAQKRIAAAMQKSLKRKIERMAMRVSSRVQ